MLRVVALVGLVGLVGLAACGGSAPGPAAPAPPPPVSSASTAPAASPADAAPTAKAAPAAPQPWPFSAQSADDRKGQLERLAKDQGPLKTNWVPPGNSERYGHAEGTVSAPVAAVRGKLDDFAHYKDLAGPKFKKVNVVDKQGDATDVYFQLPIMKGLVTIWYVTHFLPGKPVDPDTSVVEGTFVKGNIKTMHIAFSTRAGADDKSTTMTCDLLLGLNIPAPQAAIDEELRDACGDAINAVRAMVAAH